MKKTLFFAVLLVLAAAVFANDLPNRRIFIEGHAIRPDQTEYFLWNFYAEAVGTGYPVTNNIDEAAYIFRFTVRSNTQRHLDNNLYILTISLITTSDNVEVVTLDFFFTSLDEMYEYNRTLFLRGVSYIPPYTEDDMIIEIYEITEVDQTWKNKLFYLRASLDYPVTIYNLQPTGLYNKTGVFFDNGNPDLFRTMPLHHIINALPGATLGAEWQFLNFMSVEFNLKFSLGDTRTNSFVNIAAGYELKFPLKFFTNFVITPYVTLVTPINVSKVFYQFTPFALGGGIQAGVSGGKNGSFFIDVNFQFSFTDAGMHNPYGGLYPSPDVIYYKRYVVGLGIGYKFGFGSREKKQSAVNADADAEADVNEEEI